MHVAKYVKYSLDCPESPAYIPDSVNLSFPEISLLVASVLPVIDVDKVFVN